MKIKLYQVIIILIALFTISYFFIKMLIIETKEDVYKILSETEYLLQNGDWIENIDTRYEYDEEGDRKSMTVLKFFNDSWINDYKVLYVFDENKTIIAELYQNWTNIQWTDSLRIENFNKNNETGYIIYDLKTGKLVPSVKFITTLDTIDKKKEEIKSVYDNFEWKPVEISTTILNIELNPLEKITKKFENTAWFNVKLSKYNYNEFGLEFSEEIYNWKDSGWVNFERFLNKYDTANIQISRLWQKWNGKDWINGWICYYDYDDRGNLIILDYNVWSDNNWIPDERYRYTYNKEDIGTAHYIDRWKGSKWTDSLKNIYSFGKFTIKKKKVEENIESFGL